MASDSPGRRAALLLMLEDWDAGRMTPFLSVIHHPGHYVQAELLRDGLADYGIKGSGVIPTPAGLAAARAIRTQEASCIIVGHFL